MTSSGKPNPRINYPLWIIAISLLVIAICMVIDSIGRRGRMREGEVSLTPVASAPEPAAIRPAVRVATRLRRLARSESPAENAEPEQSNPADVAGPQVAIIARTHSDVSGPQPVGYSVSGILVGSNQMGEVTGRITLKGTPPAEVILTADPVCSKRSGPIMTRTFVLGESNGLADAVVFLKRGIDAVTISPVTNSVMVLLTNCEIQPYIIGVTARQPLEFRDRDGVQHVLSFGDAKPKLVVPAKAQTPKLHFTLPRLFVPVRCRLHPWETAYLCVLENPYFAVTDSDGNFDIPNVPPGTYTIEVAHQGATGTNGVARSVMVVAGKKARLDVALNAPNSASPRLQADNSIPRN